MIYDFDFECRKRFTAFANKYLYIAPKAFDEKGVLKPYAIKHCIKTLVKNDIFTLNEIRTRVKLPEEYYKF